MSKKFIYYLSFLLSLLCEGCLIETTITFKKPLKVTIQAIPWAHLSIDGVSYGETPLVNVQLEPGPHKLQFVRDNFLTKKVTLIVPEEGRKILTVNLNPYPEHFNFIWLKGKNIPIAKLDLTAIIVGPEIDVKEHYRAMTRYVSFYSQARAYNVYQYKSVLLYSYPKDKKVEDFFPDFMLNLKRLNRYNYGKELKASIFIRYMDEEESVLFQEALKKGTNQLNSEVWKHKEFTRFFGEMSIEGF